MFVFTNLRFVITDLRQSCDFESSLPQRFVVRPYQYEALLAKCRKTVDRISNAVQPRAVSTLAG